MSNESSYTPVKDQPNLNQSNISGKPSTHSFASPRIDVDPDSLLASIEPEKWNNIAIPVVEAVKTLMK